ncbi:MAG: hypothetical protein ACRBDL_01805 [Alphaproteobacteria bacterium]
MKKSIIISAVFVMVSVVAVPHVMAEQGKKKRHGMMVKMFEKRDHNQDGVISKGEFLLSAEEMFSEIDADKNGELTQDEFKEHGKKMREKHGKGKPAQKSDVETGE